MITRACRFRIAAQHACDLAYALLALERAHPSARHTAARPLLDQQVSVRARGKLWKVGHNQHLVGLGHVPELDRHRTSDRASDADVDLVEHERRNAVDPGEHRLQRKHHPGELTPAGHAPEGTELETRVERNAELHGLGAAARRLGKLLKDDPELAARHPKLGQEDRHRTLQPLGRAEPRLGEFLSRLSQFGGGGTYLFALPGSPGACKDGWDGILRYQLDYRQKPCNLVELMPRLKEHQTRGSL